MSYFQHISEPDVGEFISIDGFTMTLEFFLIQEPEYALPEGAKARFYKRGKRDTLTVIRDDIPVTIGGEGGKDKIWEAGDAYIAKKADYMNAWEEENKPTIEEVAQTRHLYLNAQAVAVINGGIESDALGTTHKYKSKSIDQVNLNTAILTGVDQMFLCDDMQEASNSKISRLHTNAQLRQVLADGATFIQTQLATVRALKAEVDAIVSDDINFPSYDDKKTAIEGVSWQ